MHKDQRLLEEAYDAVNENIITDRLSKALDIIKVKAPEVYSKIVSASSSENLKRILLKLSPVIIGVAASLRLHHKGESELVSILGGMLEGFAINWLYQLIERKRSK